MSEQSSRKKNHSSFPVVVQKGLTTQPQGFFCQSDSSHQFEHFVSEQMSLYFFLCLLRSFKKEVYYEWGSVLRALDEGIKYAIRILKEALPASMPSAKRQALLALMKVLQEELHPRSTFGAQVLRQELLMGEQGRSDVLGLTFDSKRTDEWHTVSIALGEVLEYAIWILDASPTASMTPSKQQAILASLKDLQVLLESWWRP